MVTCETKTTHRILAEIHICIVKGPPQNKLNITMAEKAESYPLIQ